MLSLDEDTGTVFRDTIMLALAGFVSLAILMLPHLNPRARLEAAAEPPGHVIIEARWPDALDADVDLWVEAPGDRPVGYSNKGATFFNLLRDDLGHRADLSDMNYEVAYSRGIPAGEYTVNLHLYRNPSGRSPMPVTVIASTKATSGGSTRTLLASRIELGREGEERTVFRFRLDAAGALQPGSVHSLQRPLRTRRPG